MSFFVTLLLNLPFNSLFFSNFYSSHPHEGFVRLLNSPGVELDSAADAKTLADLQQRKSELATELKNLESNRAALKSGFCCIFLFDLYLSLVLSLCHKNTYQQILCFVD